ncbi:hypothetical protein HanPSC8_Chr01g0020411 [Helianthus annuus]|nr:hypothetical protein HanPSC8_Chr01g0020411 [Helianthus annuus]
MADNGRRRWRLVLVASPLQGHMLQLGTYLHSKGFSITIAHPPDSSNHPDFTFLPLSGPGNFTSSLQFLQALNDNCRPGTYCSDHKRAKRRIWEGIISCYNLSWYLEDRLLAVDLGLLPIIMHAYQQCGFLSCIHDYPSRRQISGAW